MDEAWRFFRMLDLEEQSLYTTMDPEGGPADVKRYLTLENHVDPPGRAGSGMSILPARPDHIREPSHNVYKPSRTFRTRSPDALVL